MVGKLGTKRETKREGISESSLQPQSVCSDLVKRKAKGTRRENTGVHKKRIKKCIGRSEEKFLGRSLEK